MPEGNGDYRQVIHDLVDAARLNLDEHEKIWRAIDALRISQLELVGQISDLTSAIRALIDRIPPENLR